jgi:hypothetical protein
MGSCHLASIPRALASGLSRAKFGPCSAATKHLLFDLMQPMYLRNKWLQLSDAGSSHFKNSRATMLIIKKLENENSFAYFTLFYRKMLKANCLVVEAAGVEPSYRD